MGRWLIACLPAFSIALGPVSAETPAVYASNYDLQLSVDGATSQIRTSARVQAGRAIPVEMSRHRVDIAFSEKSGDHIQVELQLYRKSQGSWYRIDTGALEFSATPEIPVEFTWSSGGVEIDLALVVSRES